MQRGKAVFTMRVLTTDIICWMIMYSSNLLLSLAHEYILLLSCACECGGFTLLQPLACEMWLLSIAITCMWMWLQSTASLAYECGFSLCHHLWMWIQSIAVTCMWMWINPVYYNHLHVCECDFSLLLSLAPPLLPSLANVAPSYCYHLLVYVAPVHSYCL